MTTYEPAGVAFLNAADPDFSFECSQAAAAMAENWYAKTPLGIAVLRYSQVHELLRERRLVQSGRPFLKMNGVLDGPLYDWFTQTILNLSGTEHSRLRALVSKALTPNAINRVRPDMRAIAERLTQDLAEADVSDFIGVFASRLPAQVMTFLLGVPAEDPARIRELTSGISLVFNLHEGGDVRARAENAVAGLNEWVNELIERKRRQPGDDLITSLIAVQEGGDRLSRDELSNVIFSLILAAQDTTCLQLGRMMIAFAEHPDQWRLLAERPELAPQAVEEAARWCPVVPAILKFVAEDFEYHGLEMTAGSLVLLAVAAANRDREAFPDGDSFDITQVRAAPQLTFSAGAHFCLGAATARAEMAEALVALTARLGPPDVAGQVTWKRSMGVRGPTSLPLRFDARYRGR